MSRADDCFFCWLSGLGKAGYPSLSTHAQAAKWPKVQSLVQAWNLIDHAPDVTKHDKLELKQEAALAFVDFERNRLTTQSSMGLNAFGLGVFLFMAVTLGILALAIFEPFLLGLANQNGENGEPLLTRLAKVEVARGLITFVFVVGVIALALIIVTANVTANDGEGQRFERSKEILTSLIAIVGTILGYYFGKGN